MILPLLIALAGDTPPDITRSVWTHLPTAAQMTGVYPPRTEAPATYDIDLRCRITDVAGHVRCIVVGESPAGYGVGAKLEALFARLAVVDMQHTPGSAPGRIVVVHFRSENGG